MVDIALPTVFLAGVLSFLSPCVLPLVPGYLTYLTGATLDELSEGEDARLTRRALTQAAFFVLGIGSVFVALGAGASQISLALRQWTGPLSIAAGILIIVMGLHFLGLIRIGFLMRQLRLEAPDKTTGPLSAWLMGAAFGFGWTPCIGPVLGAVLGIAGTRDSVLEGAGLLALYAAGMGLPFLLAAFAVGHFTRFLSGFRRHLQTVERITGALLVLVGVGFLLGLHTRLANILLDAFPGLVSLT
ncbi:MAG: cytochrome c biogenesis protein CcdA [Hyphomicrobiaceae bacterium]|nr:cytochrome c biogenesis protein CcdA [Hyphomicrobiaceae bacterium]